VGAPVAAPVEYVPAVKPDGSVTEINAADVAAAQQQGWRMPTPEEWGAYQKAQALQGPLSGAVAFAEGVGEGVLGPVIPGLEVALGRDPAEMRALKEARPGLNAAGQAVGFIAPLAATLGASAPVSAGAAATGTAARLASKTLPGLATKAGAAVAERLIPEAGAGVLRRAIPAAADFATQGGILAASSVATQAVLQDPKLSAESAVAEVALGTGLGGVLGFGGSAAAHGLAGLLGKAGEKALAWSASRGENPETSKLLLSFKSDPAVREAVFKLDQAGISPNVIAPAHPETARVILGNTERVTSLEKRFPGLTEDVLAKATPDEAALILRDGDKIILGTTARNSIGEELANTTSTAFNATDDALSSALRGARSAEVDALVGKVAPEAAQGQLGGVFDEVTSLAGKMRAETDLFNQGAARKLELLAEGLARDSGEGSVDTFRRLNQAKRQLDDLASWGRKPSNNINEDTVNAIRDLRSKVARGLEDEAVWGEAGARQKDLNKALSEFWTAQDIAAKGPKGDPRRGFMVEVQQADGSFSWEARPTRINEWLNAMADARGGAKSEGFTQYLDAASRLADQLEKSGFEGAAALRDQLAMVKRGFLDTERQAAVTQVVNRLKDPSAILTSRGYIPTPKQLAGQAATSMVGSVPVIGPIAGAIEGTITKAAQPSFAIGVIDAFGKASQRMGDAIGGGVGRLFTGTAAKGVAEGTEAVINAGNYTRVSAQLRTNAADPTGLADHAHKQTGPWSQHAPGAADEATGVIARATQHLASKLPPEGPPDPFGKPYQPSPAELSAFNRAAGIAQNPASILDEIRRGTIHPDHVEALATIYPSIHRQMQMEIMDRLALVTSKGEHVPFKTRMGLSLFLGGNLDPLLSPEAMRANQLAFARDAQTGNVEPGSRSTLNLGVAGRMSTPMQASASRSLT
jgi:hypothetical protein